MSEGQTQRPYPGDELNYRVTAVMDREWFEQSGQESRRTFERALASVDRSWSDFARILDFGCGPGRIALWLEDVAADAELYGVDIDERAIRWAQEHIPWGAFAANRPEPPLDFPDGHFDLVYNHSVFTHLDEDLQDRWLTELHRVTSPGAVLLLSVNGDHSFRTFEQQTREAGGDPAPVRERYDREGIVFLSEDSWLGSAHPDCYHSTFHAPWYVLEQWDWFFEVKAYLPHQALIQDLVVLQRRDGALPAGEPPRPRRGGPSLLSSAPQAALPGGAIERARRTLTNWPASDAPAEGGGKASALRRAILRAIRPYTYHQDQLNRALVDALAEASAGPAGHLQEAHGVALSVRDGLLRQSERITRLELELLARIDELERALGERP